LVDYLTQRGHKSFDKDAFLNSRLCKLYDSG
jgi:hypothetical protein